MRREFDASGSYFSPSFFGPSFFGRSYFGGNLLSLASLLAASQTARWDQRATTDALAKAAQDKADADQAVAVNDAAFADALRAVGGSAIDCRGASPVLYLASGDTYTAATLPAIEDDPAALGGGGQDTIQGGGGDTLQGGAGNDVVLVG